MVLILLVTNSPTAPSPRVAALTKRPDSYVKLIASPSNLGSHANNKVLGSHAKLSLTRFIKAVNSSEEKTLDNDSNVNINYEKVIQKLMDSKLFIDSC